MFKMRLAAPWYTWQKKIKALFEQDPDIIVGDVYAADNSDLDFAFDIEVRNHKKFNALDRVFPKVKTFGNITLGVILYDEENTLGADNPVELYKTIFKGNPIVKDIREVIDFTCTEHAYIRFNPDVVQFPDDDISDYNGNWSGLAQDIAREVFVGAPAVVHFCTADKNEVIAVKTVDAETVDTKIPRK